MRKIKDNIISHYHWRWAIGWTNGYGEWTTGGACVYLAISHYCWRWAIGWTNGYGEGM